MQVSAIDIRVISKIGKWTYSHSVGHCMIAHLWENLTFPVYTIAYIKSSPRDHLEKETKGSYSSSNFFAMKIENQNTNLSV